MWPLFDYFFNVYAKRLEQPDDEEGEWGCNTPYVLQNLTGVADCEGDRYDLVSLAPSSDY